MQRRLGAVYDPTADPELVLELECDTRTSQCAVSKVADAPPRTSPRAAGR